MNREDLIRMAREANIHVIENNTFADDIYISVLYRFATIVAAAEREACAKLVFNSPPSDEYEPPLLAVYNAIRARGEQ
jgi:hypothetical protein